MCFCCLFFRCCCFRVVVLAVCARVVYVIDVFVFALVFGLVRVPVVCFCRVGLVFVVVLVMILECSTVS